PPRIRAADSSPLKVLVVEGQQLTLRCAADGSPPPSISWFKRLSSGQHTLSSGPVYTVASASRKCDGIFQCLADNGEEPADKREIRVVVHYRPRVSVANEQISQSRGHSTMVMCAVSGLPIRELYWEHRGRRFRPGPDAATCWSGGRHCLYQQTTSAGDEVDGDGFQTMTRIDL
uniref:Ig-like domain-containing protein n=1 Tax=Macrostomum lignano TaxID=282301 RepID=A0A1I8IRR6_9PLAT